MTVILPSKPVTLPNFLTKEENETLYKYAVEQKNLFLERVSKPDFPEQKSLGLVQGTDKFKNFKQLIVNRLSQAMPAVFKITSIPKFKIGEIESDVSVYSDKNFLGLHEDIFCSNSRKMTYIYYFHSVPKQFVGGQLVVYDSLVDFELNLTKAESCYLIEPSNNTCVLFPSQCYHQVLQVACSDFADSRFSINGWIHASSI